MRKTDEGIVLRLREEHGVRYEKIGEFSKSLFRNVYYEAFVNTRRLMDVNDTYKKANSWEHDRLYNIITFWGPRGMGKTSVMRSFLGELDNFDSEQYREFLGDWQATSQNERLLSVDQMKQYDFVCMECIDASLLDDKEDIFEVILAKMLGGFLKKVSEFSSNKDWEIFNDTGYFRYRKEDIVAKFEKIYIDLHNLQQNKKEHVTGVGAVEILRSLSGSLDLRETFKELVPLYLRVMGKQEEKKRFLVISIDDLDLNLHGYEILEQIHRYFMVPDVLIYITVAEAEVLDICNRHFGADKTVDKAVQRQRKELAKAYIDKVLPFANRIYMPTLFSETDSIIIDPEGVSIKETMLGKIALRTKVFFDGCGKKQHFYEPVNVRELVNLWCLLSRMQILDNNSPFFMYQSNMDSLMNDITNRLVIQKLNDIQKREFSPVSLVSIDRQGMALLQIIIQYLRERNPYGKFTNDYEKYGYSYGELLRGLYTLGREYREAKPFVQCVLALETVGLTNLYNVSRMKIGATTSKERLMSCFSGSICGSWGNKLVPKIKVKDGTIDEEHVWGYVKAKLDEKVYVLSYDKEVDLDISEEEAKRQAAQRFLEDETSNWVQIMELLSLFITEWKNVNEDRRLCHQIIAKQQLVEPTPTGQSGTLQGVQPEGGNGSFHATKSEKTILIGFDEATVTFDILGFVINCMRYNDIFNVIDGEMVDIFTGELGDEQREKVEKIIKQRSLRKEFQNWEKKYGYMALPAYSTDMIYNILKRAKRKKEQEHYALLSNENIAPILKTTYDNIKELLEKEDIFYDKLCKKKDNSNTVKCKTKFAMTFAECPFVKKIQEDTYDVQFRDAFQTFVNEIIQGELKHPIDNSEDDFFRFT